MKYYRTITHQNGNKQVVRDQDQGDERPHHYPPAIYRSFRSKYQRHVGAKQQAKLSPA